MFCGIYIILKYFAVVLLPIISHYAVQSMYLIRSSEFSPIQAYYDIFFDRKNSVLCESKVV